MWYIHILVPIILAIILNFYIYTQKWNNDNEKNSKLPPGYIIGSIWIIILGLLGYIHFLLYPSVYSWFIILTILYCLSYPFLTKKIHHIDNNNFNLIALILAIIVTIIMYYKSNIIYAIPFLLWTFYVNIVINVS